MYCSFKNKKLLSVKTDNDRETSALVFSVSLMTNSFVIILAIYLYTKQYKGPGPGTDIRRPAPRTRAHLH